MIVSDILNKRSLSHSFTSFCYFPYKAKGQLKIDHKTLTDSMYLEMEQDIEKRNNVKGIHAPTLAALVLRRISKHVRSLTQLIVY